MAPAAAGFKSRKRTVGPTTGWAALLSARPQPVNAPIPGVDRQFTGFYRERYLLAEADPVVDKELRVGLHENPARVIPALGTIR
jgi:hypothetical protein